LAIDEARRSLDAVWNHVAPNFAKECSREEFQSFVWKQRASKYFRTPDDVREYAQLIEIELLKQAHYGVKSNWSKIMQLIWRADSHFRRAARKANKIRHLDELDLTSIPAASDLPDKQLLLDEILQFIQAIPELSARDLLIFESMLGGVPNIEIAESLNISAETVRQVRSRLLAKLRKRFG
jgi:RNA polymerase sigma factor (sigma-70 family)